RLGCCLRRHHRQHGTRFSLFVSLMIGSRERARELREGHEMAKPTPPRRARTSAAGPPDADELTGWQQRALDRSLVDARRRALNKSNGFVRAAMKLLQDSGGLHFTVQEVVDRSNLSLRIFYQTFASKDELLLALFEEYI